MVPLLPVLALCSVAFAAEGPKQERYYVQRTTPVYSRYKSGESEKPVFTESDGYGLPFGIRVTIKKKELSGSGLLGSPDAERWVQMKDLIPVSKAERAVVMRPHAILKSLPSNQSRGKEVKAGSIALILHRKQQDCEISLGEGSAGWMACAFLSTDDASVKAAKQLARLLSVPFDFSEVSTLKRAIEEAKALKKNPQFPFMAILNGQLAQLEAELKKQMKIEEDPDYQNCAQSGMADMLDID